MSHITVLQKEAISALNLTKDSVVVDCTLGNGGHAKEILSYLGPKGTYIGIDVDGTAIESQKNLQALTKAKVQLVEENFRYLHNVLQHLHIEHVDAVIADLGWRMEQFDGEAGAPRGFSFNKEEPLAMTFGDPHHYAFTAYDIINDWKEEDIANVLYAYGEERYSRRIARKIVEVREQTAICTSTELAQVIKDAVPSVYARRRIHPATKSFQALRIAVNDEFDALRELLLAGFDSLHSGGRMSIISFHSLEDRIVKETFKALTRDQKGVLVTKKPIGPSEEELHINPRARSAKLRTIEKN